MTSRRAFLVGSTTALATPFRALGTPPSEATPHRATSHRIGMLGFSRQATPYLVDPFVEGLREAGWTDGRDVTLELRGIWGDRTRAEDAAREFLAMKVSVIVTALTGNAVAARDVTAETPIVMMTSGYPVEVGLAKSHARPGGNVTGQTLYAGTGLFAKHVELLKMVRPAMTRMAVLWNYVPPIAAPGEGEAAVGEFREAAARLGVTLWWRDTRTRHDLDAALRALAAESVEALYVTSGSVHEHREVAPRIVQFARDRRLPTMTDIATALFRAGILLTYSADLAAVARRTAYFVDRILRGARAADLPIERPSKFDLLINARTAKAIGVTLPPSLLLRADRVIE